LYTRYIVSIARDNYTNIFNFENYLILMTHFSRRQFFKPRGEMTIIVAPTKFKRRDVCSCGFPENRPRPTKNRQLAKMVKRE